VGIAVAEFKKCEKMVGSGIVAEIDESLF